MSDAQSTFAKDDQCTLVVGSLSAQVAGSTMDYAKSHFGHMADFDIVVVGDNHTIYATPTWEPSQQFNTPRGDGVLGEVQEVVDTLAVQAPLAVIINAVRGFAAGRMSMPEVPRGLVEDVLAVLRRPPVEWREYADSLSDQRLSETEDKLTGLAVYVARAARYFTGRSLGHNHADAVKLANQGVAKVRPALGYTQPKDDLNF